MEFTIRKVLPEEAEAYTFCHVSCWQSAYRGIVPDEFLDTMYSEERVERCRKALSEPGGTQFYCAEFDGKIVGRLIFEKSRDEDKPDTGEIGAIYLTEAFWSKGYGTQMMDFALDKLKCMGHNEIIAWVLEENIRARRFYEKYGFNLDGTKKELDYGKPLTAVRYVLSLRKKQARAIIEALEREYPDAICSLTYQKPYELLISVRLAAQCTDVRVNIVTKDLFARYPMLEAFAKADVKDVESIVRPCGLGPSKARDIVAMAKVIIEEYGGVVPNTMEALLRLPGVGRKTANLILGDVYGLPAVVCDTHCIRINGLLGLTDSKNPNVVEKQLREVLPPEKSNDYCHRMVLHGRAVCRARSPRCGECVLTDYCDFTNERINHQ